MFGNTLYNKAFQCRADVARVLCANTAKIGVYFPMQKFLKIFSNISEDDISPMISER
jgi:hypothetical protein